MGCLLYVWHVVWSRRLGGMRVGAEVGWCRHRVGTSNSSPHQFCGTGHFLASSLTPLPVCDIRSHPAIQRACDFLASKQQEDGGWGETFMSCVTREYVQHPKSQVVNTAWAVLSLLKVGGLSMVAQPRAVLLRAKHGFRLARLTPSPAIGAGKV